MTLIVEPRAFIVQPSDPHRSTPGPASLNLRTRNAEPSGYASLELRQSLAQQFTATLQDGLPPRLVRGAEDFPQNRLRRMTRPAVVIIVGTVFLPQSLEDLDRTIRSEFLTQEINVGTA